MTKRDFFTKVAEMVEDVEIRDFAKEQIKLLDDTNRRRKSTPAELKRLAENDKLKNAIVELLSADNQLLTSDIAEKLDISTSKASALCLQLVKDGRATSVEVKVPSVGKRKGYLLHSDN